VVRFLLRLSTKRIFLSLGKSHKRFFSGAEYEERECAAEA